MRSLLPSRETWLYSAIGAVVISLFAWRVPIAELGTRLHDLAFPVVIAWQVSEKHVEGNDLVLRGTMVKQRDCQFLPPTVARDENGNNYPVESQSKMAGMNWPRSNEPQQFGPWIVRGGAYKHLRFFNLYSCDGVLSVVELGNLRS